VWFRGGFFGRCLGGFLGGSLFGLGFGVGFGLGWGAGGEDAVTIVAFEAVDFLDGAAGLDEAGGGVGTGDRLVGGQDAVGEGGEVEGGKGSLAVGVLAGA